MERARERKGLYFPCHIKSVMLFMLITTFVGTAVNGRKLTLLTDNDIKEHLKRLNKPAMKTTESEDGDLIDCVDIYKQPAFDHPLLQNHTIQMVPSFHPQMDGKNQSSKGTIHQLWQRSGSCPKGTIPIRRTRKDDLRSSIFLESYGTTQARPPPRDERAGCFASPSHGPYHGIRGVLNLWSPHVEEPNEFSGAAIYMRGESSMVQLGWMVNPSDMAPRTYVYWKGEQGRGCFNLQCPGFVQTSNQVALGSAIERCSSYGGYQYEMLATIYRDHDGRKLWVKLDGHVLGYWPMSLFADLSSAGNVVGWSGIVRNNAVRGQHTRTQMGSGHFAYNGYRKAAYIGEMFVMDVSRRLRIPERVSPQFDFPLCYSASVVPAPSEEGGRRLFYGGPGGPQCDHVVGQTTS